MKKLTDWGSDKEDFQFFEHQLGVLDQKAGNVLMVDSILIVISTLSILFGSSSHTEVNVLGSVATICVLISVVLCIPVIWTRWATESQDLQGVVNLRDKKKHLLHASLIVLLVSLVLFVLMFIVNISYLSQGV